jgi:hypothetical protein
MGSIHVVLLHAAPFMLVPSCNWLVRSLGRKGKKKCFTPTLKHISGGWSHYNDTSKSVVDYWAQNMVTVQSGIPTVEEKTGRNYGFVVFSSTETFTI